MKYLMTAVALMTLAASPAFAAPRHMNRSQTANEAYAYVAPESGAVVSAGKVIGRDPDASIRADLLRQGDQSVVAGTGN
jgi:hypothetical protein